MGPPHPCLPARHRIIRSVRENAGKLSNKLLKEFPALADDALIGQSLNLVGPKVYSMAELVRLIGRAAGTPRPVLSLPDGLARLQASLLGLLPNPPLSTDNLDSLKVDSVDPAGFPAQLGWQATALEAMLPLLLTQGRPRDRYLQLRRQHR